MKVMEAMPPKAINRYGWLEMITIIYYNKKAQTRYVINNKQVRIIQKVITRLIKLKGTRIKS